MVIRLGFLRLANPNPLPYLLGLIAAPHHKLCNVFCSEKEEAMVDFRSVGKIMGEWPSPV